MEYACGDYDGKDWDFYYFARRRISRITELLGQEAADQAINEVYLEFGEKEEKMVWDIYANGTAEQKKALRNALWGTGMGRG